MACIFKKKNIYFAININYDLICKLSGYQILEKLENHEIFSLE